MRMKILDQLYDPSYLRCWKNPQKCAHLHLELAAVVDWGEPFVKACYFLEGDGPLAVDCYKAVLAGLRTDHIPNVRAIAQLLSGKPPADPSHEAWISYARRCFSQGWITMNVSWLRQQV